MTDFPINLTENPRAEGEGNEAGFDREFQRMLDDHYKTCRFAPYLTKYECWEYFALSGSTRGLSPEQRCERDWRLEELDAKIDRDELIRKSQLDSMIKRQKAQHLKHAGYELGPREFTLTYSPDWFEDDRAQFLMIQAIERLCSYYKDEIVYLRAVGERTKANRVHIHTYYELKGGLKITDKNMKRAYAKWNSKHHHHKVVKKVSDFLGYIDKEIKTAWYEKMVDNREV